MNLDGKTMAITGVAGFIGSRMAARAKERGMKVLGLDLAPERAPAGIEAVRADVRDRTALRRAFEGADIVFHTAAVVEEDGPASLFEAVNVEGTRNAIAAARDAGVRAFVHLSSVMVYGFDYPPDVDETGPLRGEGNPYCDTKIRSERLVLDAHAPGTFSTVAIRAGDVYGPGSRPWVTRPLELMKKNLFALPGPGVINHVHVDNLIDAIFLALEKDASGAFNVTDGRATSTAEYFGYLARACGRKLRTVPYRPLRLFIALVARLLGRRAPASPAAIDFIARRHAYAIHRARRELGYTPRIELEAGMREVIAGL